MAAPTYAQFIARCPAFSSLDEAVIQAAIDDSAALLSLSAWGDYYERAVCLDAAHYLALRNTADASIDGAFQGTGGAVASVSGAGLSTSFATPTAGMAVGSVQWYNKTIYGQEFLRLRGSVISMAVISI